MVINKVLSMRGCTKGQAPCFGIVYEWEDILTQNSNIKLSYISDAWLNAKKCFRYMDRFLDGIWGVRKSRKIKDKYTLYFEMTSSLDSQNFFNKPNVICCIIDYFIPKGSGLSAFVKQHNRAKMILVSNREVYDYLIQKKCPMYLAHFPLSISDRWMFNEEKYNKTYDVILTGRTNKCLLEWLIRYIKINPGIKILITHNHQKRFVSRW